MKCEENKARNTGGEKNKPIVEVSARMSDTDIKEGPLEVQSAKRIVRTVRRGERLSEEPLSCERRCKVVSKIFCLSEGLLRQEC